MTIMMSHLVRHLLEAVQRPDMIQGVDAGTEAAVQAKDLAVHQGSQGQVVEKVL